MLDDVGSVWPPVQHRPTLLRPTMLDDVGRGGQSFTDTLRRFILGYDVIVLKGDVFIAVPNSCFKFQTIHLKNSM